MFCFPPLVLCCCSCQNTQHNCVHECFASICESSIVSIGYSDRNPRTPQSFPAMLLCPMINGSAVHAAREALSMSGWSARSETDKHRAGVAIGSGIGKNVSFFFVEFRTHRRETCELQISGNKLSSIRGLRFGHGSTISKQKPDRYKRR